MRLHAGGQGVIARITRLWRGASEVRCQKDNHFVYEVVTIKEFGAI